MGLTADDSLFLGGIVADKSEHKAHTTHFITGEGVKEDSEDYTDFDKRQMQKEIAECEAKLAAYQSASAQKSAEAESTDCLPLQETDHQVESIVADAPDATTSAAPEVAVCPSAQACVSDLDSESVSSVVLSIGSSPNKICFDHQQLMSAAPADAEMYGGSMDTHEQQQQRKQQQKAGGSTRPGWPTAPMHKQGQAVCSSKQQPAQRSRLLNLLRRSGETPKADKGTRLSGIPHPFTAFKRPGFGKSHKLADVQPQDKVPQGDITLTAYSSLQHDIQRGSHVSTAVMSTEDSLQPLDPMHAYVAEHPATDSVPPSLLWQTPPAAVDISAVSVTEGSQLLLGERDQICPGAQMLPLETANSAGLDPASSHEAHKQCPAPSDDR